MSEQSYSRAKLLDQLVEIATRLEALEADLKKGFEQQQQAYQELTDLFTTILQKANDGIVILREGRILLANPRFGEIGGAPLPEIIGDPLRDYVRPDLVSEAVQKYEQRLAGESSSRADRSTLVRKDGSEVVIEFDAARVMYEGKDAVLVIITDINSVTKAEDELVRLRQYYLSLLEHVNIWVDILDQNGKVVAWNRAAEEITGYSKDEVIGHAKIWDYLYPDPRYRDEIFSRAMRIIQQQETDRGNETTIVTRLGYKKIISWYSRALFDDRGRTIGSIAIGLDITSLRESNAALNRANQAMTLAYDETIEGWSRALDLRDKETEGHTQRVTEMTLRLARMAGMSEAELVDVRRGALLHDIGKMGVPDAILLKPEPLSQDEWAQMRKHPEYAYMLLSPIEYLHSAIDIPYCHHEKWDGSGYPRGLKGEQIPLAARLFAVADVWDALRSDRPYRQGWSDAQVKEHIKSLAGTHLDPQAVEYFLSVIA